MAVPLLWWMMRADVRAAPPPRDTLKSLTAREIASAYLHQAWGQVILRWVELGTAKARSEAFINVVNMALDSVGVRKVRAEIARVPRPLWAQFDTMRWRLLLDP